ncbi:MAG TPA: DUF6655 family protein [Rickettsiales bacterium]|nr:DUF6655 family protein [Rickettsiales bacterium]
MMTGRAILGSVLLFALGACTTNVQTDPARTATEELLLSTASERAAAKLAPEIQPGAKVFVDNSNFEGTDSKYAIACIRSRLLQLGARLVDDKKNADIVVETRAGALSTNRRTFMVGIPQFNIPVPFASAPLPFPEIALYGTEEQKAVAKFGVTAYDTKKGALVSAQDPQYGFSHNTKKTLLIFVSWRDSDYLPENAENQDSVENDPKKTKAYIGINGNGYGTPESAPSAPAAPSAPSSSPFPSIMH